MKAESDPITDDEFLLRRVRIEKFRTNKVPLISPNAFEPRVQGRDPDTDGISLYREACLTDPAEILATVTPERHGEYAIVRIPVTLLRQLNLSVEMAPTDQIKGHVVVPELNAADYADQQAAFTSIKLALATEASKQENIVREPEPPNKTEPPTG